jgi:copper chaperone CopZ
MCISLYTYPEGVYTACEVKNMKLTTYNVEGMSCMHCVHHVTMALKEVPGVSDAKVSLAEKTALVSADESVSFEALKASVEDAGYQLIQK